MMEVRSSSGRWRGLEAKVPKAELAKASNNTSMYRDSRVKKR
jgi:hypothetical protein